MNTWQTILTILASLSIPSIGVSIFFYLKDRKYKKWEAARDLKLKEIEFEEEMARGDKEWKEKMPTRYNKYRNILVGTSTQEDRDQAAEVLEISKRKLRKISADIDYLSKLSGEKNPYELFTKKTFTQKVKEKLYMKNSILKIMGWAAVALVIPLLGNQFIEGWNWNWNDFVFAWVFWVVMATCILFITRRVPKYRVLVGTVVFLAFAAFWAMLATG